MCAMPVDESVCINLRGLSSFLLCCHSSRQSAELLIKTDFACDSRLFAVDMLVLVVRMGIYDV